MKTKEELKLLFENGDTPTQEDFWEWQNSYWHKDEKIEMTKIAGLENGLPRFNDFYAGIDEAGNASFAHLQIKKIFIQAGTLYIPERFAFNMYMSEVYLVDSIISIGIDAFSNNVIKNITLPKQLKTISERAFMVNNLSSVVIPDGVKEIKDSAFEYNQITSLYIPPTVSKIYPKAFSHNPNLTAVKLDKYTQYYADAFDPGTQVTGGTLIADM